MHKLDGSRWKVARAKQHVDAIRRRVSRFNDGDPYEIHVQKDTKEPLYAVQLTGRRLPPPEWGIVVGDIAHNLRSALDHIAYQLALLTPKGPNKRTQFPIFTDLDGYNGRGKDYIERIITTAHSTIESFQPYHARERPETGLLAILQLLNNADKHRLITPIVNSVQLVIEPSMQILDDIGSMNDGDTMYIQIPPDMEGKIGVQVSVAFDVPELPPPPLRLSTLNTMYEFIRDEVIPSFERFFEEPVG